MLCQRKIDNRANPNYFKMLLEILVYTKSIYILFEIQLFNNLLFYEGMEFLLSYFLILAFFLFIERVHNWYNSMLIKVKLRIKLEVSQNIEALRH